MFHLWSIFNGNESRAVNISKCYTIEDFVGHVDWDVFVVGGCELRHVSIELLIIASVAFP